MDTHKKFTLDFTNEKIDFQGRLERLDWKRIASIDIDILIQEGDTSQLVELISPVTFCKADSEFDHGRIDPGFIKVFRLSQLISEYLLLSREKCVERLSALEKKYNETEKEKVKLSDENLNLKESLASAKKELKKRKEMIASIQSEMLGQNNGDEFNQCPYCSKRFVSSGYLFAHIQRRHQGLPVNPLFSTFLPGGTTLPTATATQALHQPPHPAQYHQQHLLACNPQQRSSGNNDSPGILQPPSPLQVHTALTGGPQTALQTPSSSIIQGMNQFARSISTNNNPSFPGSVTSLNQVHLNVHENDAVTNPNVNSEKDEDNDRSDDEENVDAYPSGNIIADQIDVPHKSPLQFHRPQLVESEAQTDMDYHHFQDREADVSLPVPKPKPRRIKEIGETEKQSFGKDEELIEEAEAKSNMKNPNVQTPSSSIIQGMNQGAPSISTKNNPSLTGSMTSLNQVHWSAQKIDAGTDPIVNSEKDEDDDESGVEDYDPSGNLMADVPFKSPLPQLVCRPQLVDGEAQTDIDREEDKIGKRSFKKDEELIEDEDAKMKRKKFKLQTPSSSIIQEMKQFTPSSTNNNHPSFSIPVTSLKQVQLNSHKNNVNSEEDEDDESENVDVVGHPSGNLMTEHVDVPNASPLQLCRPQLMDSGAQTDMDYHKLDNREEDKTEQQSFKKDEQLIEDLEAKPNTKRSILQTAPSSIIHAMNQSAPSISNNPSFSRSVTFLKQVHLNGKENDGDETNSDVSSESEIEEDDESEDEEEEEAYVSGNLMAEEIEVPKKSALQLPRTQLVENEAQTDMDYQHLRDGEEDVSFPVPKPRRIKEFGETEKQSFRKEEELFKNVEAKSNTKKSNTKVSKSLGKIFSAVKMSGKKFKKRVMRLRGKKETVSAPATAIAKTAEIQTDDLDEKNENNNENEDEFSDSSSEPFSYDSGSDEEEEEPVSPSPKISSERISTTSLNQEDDKTKRWKDEKSDERLEEIKRIVSKSKWDFVTDEEDEVDDDISTKSSLQTPKMGGRFRESPITSKVKVDKMEESNQEQSNVSLDVVAKSKMVQPRVLHFSGESDSEGENKSESEEDADATYTFRRKDDYSRAGPVIETKPIPRYSSNDVKLSSPMRQSLPTFVVKKTNQNQNEKKNDEGIDFSDSDISLNSILGYDRKELTPTKSEVTVNKRAFLAPANVRRGNFATGSIQSTSHNTPGLERQSVFEKDKVNWNRSWKTSSGRDSPSNNSWDSAKFATTFLP